MGKAEEGGSVVTALTDDNDTDGHSDKYKVGFISRRYTGQAQGGMLWNICMEGISIEIMWNMISR